MKHLIEENPQGPNVDMIVVLGFEKHFRSHVFVCATEGRSLCIYLFGAPPKVTNFDVSQSVEKDVFRLRKKKTTFKSR